MNRARLIGDVDDGRTNRHSSSVRRKFARDTELPSREARNRPGVHQSSVDPFRLGSLLFEVELRLDDPLIN